MRCASRLSRREFLRWCGVAAAASAVAACAPATPPAGKTEETTAPTEATPVARESAANPTAVASNVEIRWADWPGMPGMKEAIDKFQEGNPGVKVVLEPFGDNFDQKLMAQAVAGTAPDIMSIYGHMFFAFADKGQLLDLKPYVEKNMTKADTDDFYPWHWPNGFTVPETGQLCGLPWKINIGCIIYNKNAFDEVGLDYPDENWDHDVYVDALRKLTKKSDAGQYERWGGLIHAWTYDWFQAHVLAFGGHIVDPSDRTKCLLGEKPAQDGLEWMRKLLWDDRLLMPDSDVQSLGGAGAMFVQGRCGIFEFGLHAVVYDVMAQIKTAPNPVKFGVMHIPKGPAGRFALGSTDGWAIYKGSKNPDWAWRYTYFLTQDYYQKVNVVDFLNQLPPRRSQSRLYEESVVKPWQAQDVDMSIFTKALEMGYPRPQEAFVKQQESQVIVQEGLDKVYRVGGTPVSEFVNVATKVDAANKAS